ncbi:NAD(P)H-binding protein [Nonomuraea sp. FMUSA5-5]|uniref:NAD(P)H-binding protein n=1 Tax=Nonomuraea composti TaxID=2720023 RepID=A0ABX1BJA0_9ACTN|nr:saccharopine dehydrogenase NADP-binding domain-containing protein [Nonomuraea sp. FMUSA5-5]NJP94858.1 NAD(P)H-binding protein [Nonomuraea sp. FMUSA5-5]
MKVAVYGASGYTGRLVTAEARRRGLDVVVSGRDESRLREVAEGAEVRVAGVDDAPALARAFEGCDVVVGCAGPFSEVGDPVVRAAIAAGAHYVDTSAEQLFLRHVFDTYAERAEQAGVSVVPAVGFDILPGDMIAHLAGAEVEPLDELTIAYQTNDFDMTRGTIRSSLQVLLDGDLAYEDGQWRPAEGLAVKRTSFTFPGQSEERPTARWPGAEIVTVPRHVRARRVEIITDAAVFTPEMISLMQLPTDQWDAVIGQLPEGPSEERRPVAEFTIVAEAIGVDGRRATGVVRATDIYGSAAVFTVEAARRLAAGEAKAGVLSPAQAFDSAAFLDCLAPYGVEWSVVAGEKVNAS